MFINQQDENGDTVLQGAIRKNSGYNQIFASLLTYGANPNIKDNQGRTILDYAIEQFNECDAALHARNVQPTPCSPSSEEWMLYRNKTYFKIKIEILHRFDACTTGVLLHYDQTANNSSGLR